MRTASNAVCLSSSTNYCTSSLVFSLRTHAHHRFLLYRSEAFVQTRLSTEVWSCLASNPVLLWKSIFGPVHISVAIHSFAAQEESFERTSGQLKRRGSGLNMLSTHTPKASLIPTAQVEDTAVAIHTLCFVRYGSFRSWAVTQSV